MLKITSRNEKLNRRLAHKETTRLLHKLFYCMFVSSTNLEPLETPQHLRIKYKNFYKNKELFLVQRQARWFQFQRYCINWQSKLLFSSSFTKARTICFLTGRSRSVYRAFRLSRLKVREYAAAGYFIGLSKASW